MGNGCSRGKRSKLLLAIAVMSNAVVAVVRNVIVAVVVTNVSYRKQSKLMMIAVAITNK